MKRKLPGFDYMRVLCALIIFLYHMNLNFSVTFKPEPLNLFLSNGNVLMTTFFMLSGFVLHWQYHDVNLMDSIDTLKRFYTKRIISLYPFFFVLVVVYFYGTGYNLADSVQKNIAMFPAEVLCVNMFFPDLRGFVGSSLLWFVSVIFFCYFLYPFIGRLVYLFEKHRWKMALILYLVSVYITVVYAFFRQGKIVYYSQPMYRLPEFCLGIVCAQIFIKTKPCKFTPVLCVATWILLLGGTVFLADKTWLNGVKFHDMALCFNIVVIPCSFLLLMAHGNLGESRNGGEMVTYLSTVTMPFYLTQGISIRILRNLIKVGAFGLTAKSNVLICCIGLLINLSLALLGYEFFDKPCKRFLNRKFSSQKSLIGVVK